MYKTHKNKRNIEGFLVTLMVSFILIYFNMPDFSGSIYEYAQIHGSDELTIFNRSQDYQNSATSHKFIFSSILILISVSLSQLLLINELSTYYILNILLKFYVFYMLYNSYLLTTLRQRYRIVLFYLILLDPYLWQLSSSLLRDSFIIPTAILFASIGFGFANKIPQSKSMIISFFVSAMILFFSRPFLPLLIAFCLFLVTFKMTHRFRLNKIRILILICGSALVYFVISDNYLFTNFMYRANFFSILDGISAFRLFLLSPGPWNFELFYYQGFKSDSSGVWWWFMIRWFLVCICIQLLLIRFMERVNEHLVRMIVFLGLFIFSYGALSGGDLFIGPRQGYVSYLFLLICVCHAFGRKKWVYK